MKLRMRVSTVVTSARQDRTSPGKNGARSMRRVIVPGMLRRLRIGAVRAGRKLAVRIARSRIASVGAKIFALIHRRRGLLLEGTLSQLRDRNNDHALFWAGAANAYPDDPAILRMQLHSALRAGNGATANAAFFRLIASRNVREGDARFVAGLANIDLRGNQSARIRARIRCFLASLRGSPDRRLAAVRLSRLILAHFPRIGSSYSRPSRMQFLHMLDRSPVARKPKQLLHRVAACEQRLAQLYPGSLFDTDISSTQRRAFVALVRNRLHEGRPFSFVRLGDGEAACLPYEPLLSSFTALDARDRERIWWGKPLDRRLRSRIYPRLARSVFDADCIGIPAVSRFLRELRLQREDALETTLTGRGLRAVLYCAENWEKLRSPALAAPIFTSCHLHQDLELWNCYGELFDGVNEVILVSCHEGLADRMYERFGVSVAGHVLLPPDRVTGPVIASECDRTLPAVLNRVIDELGDLPRGRLVMVGAGLLGKLIVGEARTRGGIALDVGSVFDHWLGFRTRSYLDLNTA